MNSGNKILEGSGQAVRKRNPALFGLTSQGDEELAREGVTQEIPLHNAIIKHCNSQWPRWLYLHANPAVKSTIAKGCQDCTIFMPGGRVVCVEVKTKTGKLSEDQRNWAHEMERLGHHVWVVRSMAEFLEAVK